MIIAVEWELLDAGDHFQAAAALKATDAVVTAAGAMAAAATV